MKIWKVTIWDDEPTVTERKHHYGQQCFFFANKADALASIRATWSADPGAIRQCRTDLNDDNYLVFVTPGNDQVKIEVEALCFDILTQPIYF